MKRYRLLSSLTFFILLLCLSGCGIGKEAVLTGLLPSRIENIMNEDRIPVGAEGAEEAEYDAGVFNIRMFVGTWKLQQSEDEPVIIEVPAPKGSGEDICQVEAFPQQMIFYDTVRGNEEEISRIPFDDYFYMQAVCRLSDTGDEVQFRMLYDVRKTTLAFGFTGEVTDTQYFNENVDAVDITEADYGFEWNGYELKLTYGGSSATYVPSTYEGDMQKACEGFSGSNGQNRMPGWQFSPLNMNGDGTGTVSTHYDTNTIMNYTFGDDGSFCITTENGEEFTFDRYWYSDSCLTLPAGDNKLMYQHDLLTFFDGDTYRKKNVESNLWMEELTIAGKKMGSPLWMPVRDLIGQGYQTNVDTAGSMIPSGEVSPEFDLNFRNAHISVRAVNPTDIALPLEACIVYRYRFEEGYGSISRRVEFLFGDGTVSCGETTVKDLQAYDNLYPVNDHLMAAQLSSFGTVDDYDFEDHSAHVLEGMDGEGASLFIVMETEGERLHAFTCYVSTYENHNLDFNVQKEALAGLSAAACETVAYERDEIAEKINSTVAAYPDTVCDANGVVYIPWSDLFIYGKAELSEEGKLLLDKLADLYMDAIGNCGHLSGVEIGAYARCELTEEGQSFTVPRAEVVCSYLNDVGVLNGEQSAFIPAGYRETDYRRTDAADELGGNLIGIRFLLEPAADAADTGQDVGLIYKETEGNATYRYMEQDPQQIGKKRAAFAEKYAGTYDGSLYTNEAIGMEWQLPEGWHFYNDDELTAYNGASAETLLLKDLPIYSFAAVNDDYDAMIDMRLYPCDGTAYETAAGEIAESLFHSYESVCRTDYGDVSVEAEDVTIGGRTVKTGTFRFTVDDQVFVRRQYYLVYDDAAVVITLSGTEGSEMPDDPGLK